MNVSRRFVAALIADRLAGVTHATGYYGQVGRTLAGARGVDPPTKSDSDSRVAPYFVLYPTAGAAPPDEELAHHAATTALTLPVQVTAVAGDVADLLALVDRIDTALHRWRPTATGYGFGPLTRPVGWVAPPNLIDHATTPSRLYLPLEYETTATTTEEPTHG